MQVGYRSDYREDGVYVMKTPLEVSGLGSGIAMIALGGVRFVAIASESLLRESRACAFD